MPIVNDKGYSPSDTPNGSIGYNWSNKREDLEPRTGLDPPKAIGVLSSSPQACPKLVYSGDAVGPNLYTIPLRDRFIWVWARSVFSKMPVLRQAKRVS